MLPTIKTWFDQVHLETLMDDDMEEAWLFFGLIRRLQRPNPTPGGSRAGRAPNADRNFEDGYQRIYRDYFADSPCFSSSLFRRRFRMRRELFLRILEGVREQDPWFEQKTDAIGKKGMHPLQKVVAAIRILAYGCSYDMVDEYVRVSESSASECVDHFCSAVINKYGQECLRNPTMEDLKRILEENAARGFPGMIGSIDCMHWKWDNCPVAWQGSFRGVKGTSIVLEAAVSYDLWFWHSFFGMPGSMNDINVLQRSPILHSFLDGTMPRLNYEVNGNSYDLPYWLADGIYPNWPIFMKTIPDPQGAARKKISQQQEKCRKDVERAFGVLQKRFSIVRNPARSWKPERLKLIMTACICLHNMIVEDRRLTTAEAVSDDEFDVPLEQSSNRRPNKRCRRTQTDFNLQRTAYEDLPSDALASMVSKIKEFRDHAKYFQLQSDLVADIWKAQGNLD